MIASTLWDLSGFHWPGLAMNFELTLNPKGGRVARAPVLVKGCPKLAQAESRSSRTNPRAFHLREESFLS